MGRKHFNIVSEAIAITEPVIVDIIEDTTSTTTEEYKKLNDKCDIVITKIKNRKKQKK